MLGAVGAAFRAFGSSGQVTRPLRDGDELRLRDRTLRVLHRPGHSPSDTVFWDERAPDPDRRRPPAGAHLLQPAGLAARSTTAEARRRRSPRPADALIDYLDSMRRDPRAAGRARAGRPRRSDHRPRGADRRAHSGCTSAGRARSLRMLEPGPLTRVRAGAPDVGQRRRDPGLPDDLRGARPPRPAGPRRAARARASSDGAVFERHGAARRIAAAPAAISGRRSSPAAAARRSTSAFVAAARDLTRSVAVSLGGITWRP